MLGNAESRSGEEEERARKLWNEEAARMGTGTGTRLGGAGVRGLKVRKKGER
jgi:hypothetical protein